MILFLDATVELLSYLLIELHMPFSLRKGFWIISCLWLFHHKCTCTYILYNYVYRYSPFYLQVTTALLLQMSRPSSSVQRAPTVLRGHPAPPPAQRAHSPMWPGFLLRPNAPTVQGDTTALVLVSGIIVSGSTLVESLVLVIILVMVELIQGVRL